MIERPTLNPIYHAEVSDPEGVFLLSERGHLVLKGKLNCQLVPLLDGSRTVDQIVDTLYDRAQPAQVYYALTLMERKGYVVAATSDVSSEQAAFWRSLEIDPSVAQARLNEATVALTSLGNVPPEGFAAALATVGIRVASDDIQNNTAPGSAASNASGPPGEVAVVLTDDYLREELKEINRTALASGRPWMLIKPVGTILWIGPIFRPGRTGCWSCLAHRLSRNREVEYYLQRIGKPGPFRISRAALPSTMRTAYDLAATETAIWLARGEHPRLEGAMTTLEVLGPATQHHTLVRRPQCPECGDRGWTPQREPTPIVLRSQKKHYVADGGHRSAVPEKTIATYQHHVSPITGVVSMLARVNTDEDHFLHTYVAGHNFAYQQLSLAFLKKGLRTKSAGKGVSDAQARASGLCEAMERYSGMYQGDEIRRTASYRELGADAVHIGTCMLYSERQFRDSEAWNARGSGFQVVCNPLDEDARFEWSPVWSHTERRFKYLPTAYLYFSYPYRADQFYAWADSNGNAAGNTLEEAILQGFMELVERDSVAIWWYNRLRRPAVDLDSFDEPYFREVRERYRRLNRDLWMLDVTSDLGVPSFAALSRRVDKPAEDILFAFGAHFDPRIAALRAVTELNQFLPAVIRVKEDGTGYEYDDQDCLRWWKSAKLAEHPYLLPDDSRPAVRAADYPHVWSDDVLDDVTLCQQIVERKGMELLVLDQTRPDIGLPVAKVIVPGMRHFWARLGPGRLYDVPVEQNWLNRRLAEEELNPVAMFI